VCTHAATQFYIAGARYTVYEDGGGTQYIMGEDGLWDKLGKTSSRFVAIDNSKVVKK
jgi:hypothetical protein